MPILITKILPLRRRKAPFVFKWPWRPTPTKAVEPPKPFDETAYYGDPETYDLKCARLQAARDALNALDLSTRASVIRETLMELARKAGEGDGAALWCFAEITHAACHTLSRLTAANPGALAPVAARKVRWPLMRARAPRLSDPDTRLREIGLGADQPLQADQHSKFKPDTAARIAAALIAWLRSECPPQRPLTRDQAAYWWPIAWRAFLRSCPHPEAMPELVKAIVTSPSRRVNPSRKRETIMATIRARFCAMLPAQT
jgi:hypothetical protein